MPSTIFACLLLASLLLQSSAAPSGGFGHMKDCGQRGHNNADGSCRCTASFIGSHCQTHLSRTCTKHSDCHALLSNGTDCSACISNLCVALDHTSCDANKEDLQKAADSQGIQRDKSASDPNSLHNNCHGRGEVTGTTSCRCDTHYWGDHCEFFESTHCSASRQCPDGSHCFQGRCTRPATRAAQKSPSTGTSWLDGINLWVILANIYG